MLPEARFESDELRGTLRVAIEGLPQPQRDVLTRHYLGGVQLTEIAAELGVSVARVSQVRLEAVNALRAYLATIDVGVPEVSDAAPGGRARRAYVHAMSHTRWRERVNAAPAARRAWSQAG